MAAANLANVMDAIGARVTAANLVRNVYSYPVSNVIDPCVVVGYPTNIDISDTFGRGSDSLTIPVFYLIAQEWNQATRDAMSAIIAGGADLIAAIEGSYASGDVAVTDVKPTSSVVGGIEYLGLELTVDVQT